LYWFLEVFFLSALRFTYRYFRYTRVRRHARIEGASPTLLIGRAADAEILLRGIESGAVKQLWPVGVLSPSAADRGQSIRNIPVLGGVDDIEDIIRDFSRRDKVIKRVVMTPSAFDPEARPESVLMRARRLGLIVSRLPSLESGDAPRLTAVAVEDLLLRPSEKIDYARLEALVKNKAVIVTGGGGSIGSEICDRIVTFGAARLLVIENSEPALYAITEALAAHEIDAVIEGRIADIRDRERILQLMHEFKPDIVFHAAALKHVPILERDWSEGVKTNIFGSVNVADAALAAGAEAMVMISTDKAIEPVSMLGLTKRFAEMYCQALDHELASLPGNRQMRLISVRFGNVLASNGSVVPKFKAQIEAGGPVTVTHPDMVRYFMTIREACDLVITAATHALAPERPEVSVYVLNMGQPVKIVDLAERMIRLSGLQPGHDIEIVFTGMRPGERLNEILFATAEPTVEIGVPGIMAAKPNEPHMQTVRKWITALEQAVDEHDQVAIRAVLRDAVPDFGSTAA
jgi:FlaA1/EpsC-like NDP-sugar epimerase